jgi:hypothetical protein
VVHTGEDFEPEIDRPIHFDNNIPLYLPFQDSDLKASNGRHQKEHGKYNG